jgi:Cu2+-containing amine oxidase
MGNIHWEVRATGIMSVTPIEEGVDPEKLKYGTIVAPGVFAPHHQHLFALRIEPAIDAYDNSILAYDETKPMPRDEKNPYGVGFEATTTRVEKETAFNLDASVNRVIKFLNPDKLNPVTGKPIGYKLTAPPTQLGLAVPGSMHDIRGEFVNNHVHYTKHNEEEMFAAGSVSDESESERQ